MKAGSHAPGWRPLPIIQICAKGASCCHIGLDAQIESSLLSSLSSGCLGFLRRRFGRRYGRRERWCGS